MFLREKRVKDNYYLYAVENIWQSGKVKQKVKKYLGRIHNFNITRSISFEKFIEKIKKQDIDEYLMNSREEEIVYDLICWELHKRGFKIEKYCAHKKGLKADFKKKRNVLNCNGRPFCIKCKEGYINNLSIQLILNAGHSKKEGDVDKKKVAFDFARLFVEGGIKIPKDVFIELFHKKYLDENIEYNKQDEDIYIRY